MGATETGASSSFVSLDMTEQIYPDHDYPSTADNLWHYGADGDSPCFTINTVPAVEIDPGQLLDDPDATDSQAKVESIQGSIREAEPIPPVYLLHTPAKKFQYYLFEGMHRFTATHREGTQLLAWVAHLGCCGGPSPIDRTNSGLNDD